MVAANPVLVGPSLAVLGGFPVQSSGILTLKWVPTAVLVLVPVFNWVPWSGIPEEGVSSLPTLAYRDALGLPGARVGSHLSAITL